MIDKCTRCDGCGQIADTDEGEPWTQWANLPVQSATAVLMGIVRPIPCPACGGAGVVLDAAALPDLYAVCAMLIREDQTHKVPTKLIEAAIAAKDKARGAE